MPNEPEGGSETPARVARHANALPESRFAIRGRASRVVATHWPPRLCVDATTMNDDRYVGIDAPPPHDALHIVGEKITASNKQAAAPNVGGGAGEITDEKSTARNDQAAAATSSRTNVGVANQEGNDRKKREKTGKILGIWNKKKKKGGQRRRRVRA